MGIAIESFKKGFDWIRVEELYTLFAVVIILGMIPFISVLSGIVAFFWILPRAMAHYGLKSRFLNDKIGMLVAAIVQSVYLFIAVFLNWRQKNIMNVQIGIIAAVVVTIILAVAIHRAFFVLTAIAFIAGIVVAAYNGLRFSQTSMIYLSSETDVSNAMDKSWAITEGKLMSVIGLNLLLGLFGMVAFGVVIIITMAFALVPVVGPILSALASLVLSGLLMSMFYFTSYFADTNLLISISGKSAKKQEKK